MKFFLIITLFNGEMTQYSTPMTENRCTMAASFVMESYEDVVSAKCIEEGEGV